MKKMKLKKGVKFTLFVLGGIFFAACVAGALIAFDVISIGSKKEKEKEPIPEPTPIEEPVEVKKLNIMDENSDTRPIGVVINNYPSAMKAQTGLNDAYIIYEFPIEGGYSRSVAIFKDKNTSQIGTVRSARQYHPYFAIENDAIFVHWGGNHPAYDVLSSTKINHIDANSSMKAFFRKNPYKLATEHTGYTNMDKIKSFAKDKKWRMTSTVKPPIKYSYDEIDFSTDETPKVAKTIELNYSGSYKLKYTYNSETKKYERHYNSKDHKDYITGKFFDTKNLIISFVSIGTVKEYKDAAGTNYLDMTVTGSGKGWYITNGYAREITWNKSSKTAQTVYKYTDGTEINVNDGNTYVNFFNKSKSVSIK